MKRKVLFIVVGVLVLLSIIVTVIPLSISAADTEPETDFVTETATEIVPEKPSIEIDSEEAKEVIDVLENTSSKAEAILVLAERLGITAEDAEILINAVIDVGDEYFGQDQWWVAFKNNVQSDMQFWTVVVVVALCIIVIALGIFVLLVKTGPAMKKAIYHMQKNQKVNDDIVSENSQTLGDLKNLFKEIADKEILFEKLLEEKEEFITNLQLENKKLAEAASVERTNMLRAEMYNLRMLKLICDRTAMPLTDKATIDLFYAKGVEALKEELSDEDVEKIEKTMATLNAVNVAGDKS